MDIWWFCLCIWSKPRRFSLFIVLICIIDVTATIKSGQPLNSSLTDTMMFVALTFLQQYLCFSAHPAGSFTSVFYSFIMISLQSKTFFVLWDSHSPLRGLQPSSDRRCPSLRGLSTSTNRPRDAANHCRLLQFPPRLSCKIGLIVKVNFLKLSVDFDLLTPHLLKIFLSRLLQKTAAH